MSPRHPFIVLCQAAENDAYRDADVVVSMLPKVHEHMAAHGLDLRKLHIVPNGIALEEWEQPAEPLRARRRAHIDAAHATGGTVVGYAGSHGAAECAGHAARRGGAAARTEPFSFVLVGDGHERALAQRVDTAKG